MRARQIQLNQHKRAVVSPFYVKPFLSDYFGKVKQKRSQGFASRTKANSFALKTHDTGKKHQTKKRVQPYRSEWCSFLNFSLLIRIRADC